MYKKHQWDAYEKREIKRDDWENEAGASKTMEICETRIRSLSSVLRELFSQTGVKWELSSVETAKIDGELGDWLWATTYEYKLSRLNDWENWRP